MAVHMVIDVENESFNVTLSRDDAGNYVADATGPFQKGRTMGASMPVVRTVDATKEIALKSLLDSLQRAAACSQAAALREDGGASVLG